MKLVRTHGTCRAGFLEPVRLDMTSYGKARQAPGRRQGIKRAVPVAVIVLLLAAALAMGLWQQYRSFLSTPLAVGDAGMVLTVERGSSIRAVVAELERRGVTRMDWRWRLLNRLQLVTIQAGEYALVTGMAPADLLMLLASGKVITYRFTIVEGWNVRQLLAALGRDAVLHHSLFRAEDLQSLDSMPTGHGEGWFLPETYIFVRGDSDLNVLQRAYGDMQAALEQTWSGRDVALPYETPYEMLIMASIVEKETSRDDERTAIAGVLVRRLQKKWRLETDPSVIYGMGEAYDGNIRRRDLNADTPYNTYTRHGLPPTPIALPGLASLQAAAHPAQGDTMFFVADGLGGHTFSVTLEEHNKAVQRLLKRNTGLQEARE